MFTKLLKVGEVAQLLSISKSYAYILVKRGEITSIHIGKSRRIRVEDLDQFVSNNIITAADYKSVSIKADSHL